jgi:hypothetical protein
MAVSNAVYSRRHAGLRFPSGYSFSSIFGFFNTLILLRTQTFGRPAAAGYPKASEKQMGLLENYFEDNQVYHFFYYFRF